jgi:hypothetical protein
MFIVAVLCVQGCAGETTKSGQEPAEMAGRRAAALDQARQKRESRIAELKAMDVVSLSKELAVDSAAGREPFNSLVFAETVSRGEASGPALAGTIVGGGRSSLLALLALKQINGKAYSGLEPAMRVSILVDALRTSKYFNTWGLPHVRWEAAARALIEEGPAAQRPLRELLTDKRDAPVWGVEDFAEYQQYRYRVCDYAWALLNEIGGRKVVIPEDPAARDRLQVE